jgi:aspartate 1-decarboxylase
MEAANIVENNQIEIQDINGGERFSTYPIKGERNSG